MHVFLILTMVCTTAYNFERNTNKCVEKSFMKKSIHCFSILSRTSGGNAHLSHLCIPKVRVTKVNDKLTIIFTCKYLRSVMSIGTTICICMLWCYLRKECIFICHITKRHLWELSWLRQIEEARAMTCLEIQSTFSTGYALGNGTKVGEKAQGWKSPRFSSLVLQNRDHAVRTC